MSLQFSSLVRTPGNAYIHRYKTPESLNDTPIGLRAALETQGPLTEDQQKALDRLEAFLESDIPCFLLKGHAGTGKTFLTKGITRHLKSLKWKVELMAPTGRAARILANRTGETASTIHKGIYNLNSIDEELTTRKGKEKYKFRFRLQGTVDNTRTVVIVDEASMVADNEQESDFFVFGSGRILKDLLAVYAPNNVSRSVKVLFIGDDAQLPPVGDKVSGALSAEYLKENFDIPSMEYRLTQVVRQGGESGILKVAGYLRETLAKTPRNSYRMPPAEADVHHTDPVKGVQTYLDRWRTKGPEEAVIIHFRNEDAFQTNKTVRSHLFPGKDDIQQGDRLIVGQNNYNHEVELLNGTFVTVTRVYPERLVRPNIRSHSEDGEDVRVTLAYRKVEMDVPTENGPFRLTCLILENYLEQSETRLSYEENIASYIDFKIRHPDLRPKTQEFGTALRNDPFFNAVKVKYGYAVTGHKSQGGEWQTAIVDLHTPQSPLSDLALRWHYTAVTRAQTDLHLFNIPTGSPYSKLRYNPISLDKPSTPGTGGGHIALRLDSTHRAFIAGQGLDRGPTHLLRHYHSLLAQIQDTDIQIVSRTAHDYQEKYLFKCGGTQAGLTFWYNGKGQFTNTKPTAGLKSDPGLTQRLLALTAEPVAFTLDAGGDAAGDVPVLDGPMPAEEASLPKETGISFPESHREQEGLYLDLLPIFGPSGIEVEAIRHESFRERYSLARSGEKACIDFVYDARNMYTYAAPVKSGCNSQALLDDIGRCIERLTEA